MLGAAAGQRPPGGASAAVGEAPGESRSGPFDGRRFGIGAVVGYGGTIEAPHRVELEPLSWFLGLRFSYDFASGVLLGAYVDYSLGSAVTRTYQFEADAAVRVRVETGLTNGGLSLGYDERLGPLVLRYALDLGFSWLRWKLEGAPDEGLRGYRASSGGEAGFHVAPGLGLFWPIDRAYVGLEYRYLIQLEELIPAGVTGYVHTGVRW